MTANTICFDEHGPNGPQIRYVYELDSIDECPYEMYSPRILEDCGKDPHNNTIDVRSGFRVL